MKHLLILIALAASAQQIKINPITGLPDLVGSSSGGGCTAGTGITCVGSTISVDTAVIQSRATAQSGASTYCASVTGSDTYTCSLTPTLTAYTAGSCLVLNPDTANTGTATLNVDALGAKSILGPFGSALADGDIPAGPSQVCYNGTAFIRQGGTVSTSNTPVSGAIAVFDGSGGKTIKGTSVDNGTDQAVNLLTADIDAIDPVAPVGFQYTTNYTPTAANTGNSYGYFLRSNVSGANDINFFNSLSVSTVATTPISGFGLSLNVDTDMNNSHIVEWDSSNIGFSNHGTSLVDTYYGVYNYGNLFDTASIGDAYMYYGANLRFVTGTPTVTGSTYGIYQEAMTRGAANWNIYSAAGTGTQARNYLGGNTGIGPGNDTPTTTLSVRDVAGSTVAQVLIGGAQTSKSVPLVTDGRIGMALTTPTTSAETCAAGTFTADANYIYVCTSSNTWKRAALTAF